MAQNAFQVVLMAIMVIFQLILAQRVLLNASLALV